MSFLHFSLAALGSLFVAIPILLHLLMRQRPKHFQFPALRFVQSRKNGKTLIYRPLLEKDTYQARSLQNLSRTLFDDTPASLVARLVDDAGLTEADLEEIRALVERRLQNDSG